MKIQLKSLRVLNCGPLRDVCIQFNTNGDCPVTVLAGANGSGKTTTLELCATLPQLLNRNSVLWLREHTDSLEGWLLHRTEFAQLDCMVNDKPVSVCFSHDEPKELGIEGEWDLTLAMNGYVGIRSGQSEDVEQLISQITYYSQPKGYINVGFDDIQNTSGYKTPSILFFPHTRSLLPVRGTQVQREETRYEWVYRYKFIQSFDGSLDSYLIWLDYAEPEVYAQVIDFLNALDFEGKKFGVQRKELRAIVTTRDGQIHGVAELSSGEQNILIMLLELRRRLLPYSIVLIDEIENSLHAAFQHRLAQGLKTLQKEIPFQLIVTTHSSLFGRIFGTESVRILTEF